MQKLILDATEILNEVEKYNYGLYTFNEIMTRIDNSTTIEQLVYFEDYLIKHESNYPTKNIQFASEFINEKFTKLKLRIIEQSL